MRWTWPLCLHENNDKTARLIFPVWKLYEKLYENMRARVFFPLFPRNGKSLSTALQHISLDIYLAQNTWRQLRWKTSYDDSRVQFLQSNCIKLRLSDEIRPFFYFLLDTSFSRATRSQLILFLPNLSRVDKNRWNRNTYTRYPYLFRKERRARWINGSRKEVVNHGWQIHI